MKFAMKFAAAAVVMIAASGAFAQKGETVKLVRIDPLTGMLGPVGVSQLKGYQFFAEKYSGKGNPAGVNFEVIGMDNKLSPTESLNALKAAIDQGVRYIIQGNGSSVALALSDAVAKHNERNPGKEVVRTVCKWPNSPRKPWHANALTSRSWAKTCTHWPRCATLLLTLPKSRPQALTQ